MQLRIGTFNIWGLPEPFAEDVLPRIEALARQLPDLDLDVLMIQEAWTPAVREALAGAALDGGWHEVFAPEAPAGGLMLLSRHPLHGPRFRTFRFRGDPERLDQGEYLGGKGFVSADLAVGAGRLHLVNTHLHARYRKDRPALNAAVQLVQMLDIVAHLRGVAAPAVVAGDFNCEPGEVQHDLFTGLAGVRDAARPRPGLATICRSNHYKSGRKGRDKRIDFVFLRDAADASLEAGESWRLFDAALDLGDRLRPPSDHYGAAAEVAWEAGPPRVLPPPLPDAGGFDAARELLARGRAESQRRGDAFEASAGSWAAGAAAALLLSGRRPVSRRRLLRGALLAAGALAVAPAGGYVALSRWSADAQQETFTEARHFLDRVQAEAGGAHA